MASVKDGEEEASVREIKKELEKIGGRYATLRTKYRQFLYWFMWRYFDWGREKDYEPPEAVLHSLCDNARDHAVDAVHLGNGDRRVSIVQSKYVNDWRTDERVSLEDLKPTLEAVKYLESGDQRAPIYMHANEDAKRLLRDAAAKIAREGYSRQVILISNKRRPTPRTLRQLQEEYSASGRDIRIVAREDIVTLWVDFLQGHNPPIGTVTIRAISDSYLHVPEVGRHLDLYSTYVPASELVDMHTRFRERGFDANVRSYQGDTKINKGIRKSAELEPELFVFKNGGVTLLAKDAQWMAARQGGQAGFVVEDPQVINGQQTIRSIATLARTHAVVLLSIIQHRDGTRGMGAGQNTITDIIAARNFQNKIDFSDLKANYEQQVRLWRHMRELGYYYERKRRGWQDIGGYGKGIYQNAAKFRWARIGKAELAQEIIAVIDDPKNAYKGRNYLFDERYEEIFGPEHNVNWYLALHLLSRKHVYQTLQRTENTYPRHHITAFIWKRLGITDGNAPQARIALEGEPEGLVRMVAILARLCDDVLKGWPKAPKQLSANDLFAKTNGVLNSMETAFESKKFWKGRREFLLALHDLKEQISETV